MALQRKTIGRISQWLGDYQPGKSYKEKNRVTLLGSEFESLHDGNDTVPATIDSETHELVVNTEHWKVVSNGTTPYTITQQLNDLMADIRTALDTLNEDGVIGRLQQLEQTVEGWPTKQDILESVDESYVAKQQGKGLSENDFTNLLKGKLDNLPNSTQLSDTLAGKTDKAATEALAERLTAIEELIGDPDNPDADDVINKIHEVLDFFQSASEDVRLSQLIEAVTPATSDDIAEIFE